MKKLSLINLNFAQMARITFNEYIKKLISRVIALSICAGLLGIGAIKAQTTTCYTFDEDTVPVLAGQHAFNTYGNGNPGFLSDWHVTSGTPSIEQNGTISGVSAYEGNQYALIGPCNASAGWGDSFSLSHNFLQGHSYQVSMAVRTKVFAGTANAINMDFTLLDGIIPFNYQTQTGCTQIPALPSGALTVHSLSNYSESSWQVITFNISGLTSDFSQLWFRPSLDPGDSLSTIYFMIDSLCIHDNPLCSNIISYSNISNLHCNGDSIQFVSTASSAPFSALWDFGDGTTSTELNPIHLYPDSGNYTVTLTTIDSIGCSAESTVAVMADGQFIATAIAISNSLSCVGDTVQFLATANAPIASVDWHFEPGGTSVILNPWHIFTSPGMRAVTLTAVDVNGCTAQTTTVVTTYPNPSVNITASPQVACQECVILGTSPIGGTPPYLYSWTDVNGFNLMPEVFQDGICHANNEIYTLSITDSNGCMAKDSVSVSAYNPIVDTFYLCSNSSVTLDFGPGASDYHWQNFTDTSGNSTALSATTQTFLATQPGTYFGYANFPGCGALTSLIHVADSCNSTCVNNFSYLYLSQGVCGDSVYFIGSASGQVNNWHWDFGDGSTSNTVSPIHFFSAGVHTISLTTIDANGCSAISQQTLTILGGLIVDAGNDTTVCQSAAQLFAGVSIPGNYTYQWLPALGLDNPTIANPRANMVNNQLYTVTVIDTITGCSASDSVHVSSYNFVVDTFIFCGTQGVTLDLGPGANAYIWQSFTDVNGNSLPLNVSTQTYNAIAAGQYFSGAVFPVCGSLTSLFTVLEMCQDSVWPGDANADNHANNIDLLALGIAYGANGPVRANASNSWVGQPAYEWTDTLASGVNYKHVDCDGNGTLNMNDTLAIVLNYGLVHNKTNDFESATEANPLLFLVITQDTVGVGTQVTADIHLGTANQPANDVYGLAFSINFNPALIDSNSIHVSYGNSWLGTIDQDLLGISHVSIPHGRVDCATTRINHQNISGYGPIASLKYITIDNLSGKLETLYEQLDLIFSDVVMIDKDENELPVNQQNASMVIKDDESSIKEQDSRINLLVFPNPAINEINVACGEKIIRCKLVDATGRLVVDKEINSFNSSIDISQLTKGLYIIEVETETGKIRKAFTVMDL